MCFALILAATLGAFADEPPPSPSKPDIAAYNEAAAKAGQECRCPGSPGALVRGARPDGRAAQASVAGRRLRTNQHAGTRPDGTGCLSREMGASGGGQPRSTGRPRTEGADQGVSPVPG